MKKILIPAVVIAIIAISAIIMLHIKNKAVATVPDLSLHIINGSKIDLHTLKGKPVLVTFWATTCSTCVKEIPHLVKLYNELGNDVFEIIGIAMPYDPPNLVISMTKKENITFPVALDIQGDATKAFGNVQVTPTSFLIDPQGNIVESSVGEIDIDELRKKVIELHRPISKVS